MIDRLDFSIDRETFDTHVHEALAHLYDLAFLQKSPLVGILGLRRPDGSGGSALHRALLAVIEQLKPPPEVSPEATSWKTYRSLTLRYVRSLSAAAAAAELGVSARQAQRIHLLALSSVSATLWENWRVAAPSPAEPAPPLRMLAESEDERALDDELAAILAGDHGELEPFPSIVRSALATVEPILRQRRSTSDVRCDPKLAHSIAPHDLTRQALVLLILGVIDQTGPGRLIIAAEDWTGGARLALTVEDAATRAVEAQPDRPLERRLLVASRLLSAMGGQLVASEKPRLSLEATLPLGLSPTVLTIEDNEQVVQLYRRYLAGSIYRLVSVADAGKAVHAAVDERPAVITLDVMMPHRDGWEVLQALKVHPDTRGIPVIVCSVLREKELALALGAADFLTKPVSQHTLLDALNRHVSPVRLPRPTPPSADRG